MKKIKGSWAVKIDTNVSSDKIHPVIDYLNRMYGKTYGNLQNKGCFYYGVTHLGNTLCSLNRYNYSKILTEQEFLNLTQEMTKQEIENYKNFKKGDILTISSRFCTVVETLGDVVFISSVVTNLNESFNGNVYSHTKKGIYELGWRLYVPKKENLVVELTLDEVAKKFGIPVEQLKIKK